MLKIKIIISISFLIGMCLADSSEDNENETPSDKFDEIIQDLGRIAGKMNELSSISTGSSSSEKEETDKKANKIAQQLKSLEDILIQEFPTVSGILRPSNRKFDEILQRLDRLTNTADAIDDAFRKSTSTTSKPRHPSIYSL